MTFLQNELPHLLIDVDFSKGPNHLPPVFRNHPHQEVPLLVDGDVVVFEAYVVLISPFLVEYLYSCQNFNSLNC